VIVIRKLLASGIIGTMALGVSSQTPPPPAAPTAPKTGAPPADAGKTKSLTKEEEEARAAFIRGDLEKCQEELRKALKANPLLPPVKVMIANLFYEAQRGQNCREAIEVAAAEDPGHPDVYLANGSYAFGENRLTEAILNLKTALSLAENPRFDAEQRARFIRESRLGLSYCFERRRDYASVKEHLNALLSTDPKNSQHRSRVAAANFNLGSPETAFADLQAAFKDDPLLNPPELQMGLLWAARADDAKAEEWMKKAVSTHSTDARVHRGYAGWLMDSANFDAARPYLDSAEKIAPTARDTLFLRGLFHRYTKNYPEAEKSFEALYRESPSDIQAIGNLAIVLCESGDPKKMKRGVELAESVVRQTPKAAEAYAVLGWCYFKNQRLDEADKTLGQSIQGGQANLDTVYYLAKLFNERGKFEEAAKFLKEALAKKGPFVYRPEATVLYAEVEKKVPVKPAEPKKP
jgi:tetratricopeptide (TPR) repeat protein